MAKRTFASAGFLAVVLAAAHGQPASGDDGCAVLKELVESSVHAAATEFRADRHMIRARLSERAGSVGSTISGRQICDNTVEVTTRAFSRALGALNMPVSWSGGPMDPGDYCWSGDLSQCYPSRDPFQSALPPRRVAFVHDAWKGVRNAVASQMPFGTTSGLSRFTSASLDSALSSNLDAFVDGPLY
ncbi:MAG: hypothetical protein WD795_04850 [Woeseia sp.]